MSNIMIAIAAFLISAVIFSIVGYYVRKKVAESKIGSAEEEAKRIKNENIIKTKEKAIQIRNDIDKYIKERRCDILAQEKRLIQKE